VKATTIELIPSGPLTADGFSAPVSIATLTMVAVGVDITAILGTTPTLSLWLQVSDDGGTTYYDFPYDLRLKLSTAATDQTATTNKRNIIDAATAIEKTLAIYKHMPATTIRLAYDLGGTSPSFTLSASLVGK